MSLLFLVFFFHIEYLISLKRGEVQDQTITKSRPNREEKQEKKNMTIGHQTSID